MEIPTSNDKQRHADRRTNSWIDLAAESDSHLARPEIKYVASGGRICRQVAFNQFKISINHEAIAGRTVGRFGDIDYIMSLKSEVSSGHLIQNCNQLSFTGSVMFWNPLVVPAGSSSNVHPLLNLHEIFIKQSTPHYNVVFPIQLKSVSVSLSSLSLSLQSR